MLWRVDTRHRDVICVAELCHSCFLDPFPHADDETSSDTDDDDDSDDGEDTTTIDDGEDTVYRIPPAPSVGYGVATKTECTFSHQPYDVGFGSTRLSCLGNNR